MDHRIFPGIRVFRGTASQGPNILGGGLLPLPDYGDKVIHHRPEPPDALFPGPLEAYLIPPGGYPPPQGTFDRLQVPVVRPAYPGQELPVIQYDGNTILQ
jgi:hypothetical protein